jgi:hypothetical protein
MMDEKLTKSHPFVDGFVTNEYTEYGSFNCLPKHPNNLNYRRYPRDVDSNMVEDMIDLENMSKYEKATDSVNTSSSVNLDNETVTNDDNEVVADSVFPIVILTPDSPGQNVTNSSTPNPQDTTTTTVRPNMTNIDNEIDTMENESRADTIAWIRKHIGSLLKRNLPLEDVKLLKELNKTLSTPNMDKLFELTVAFMKISNRIEMASPQDTSETVTDGEGDGSEVVLASEEVPLDELTMHEAGVVCKYLNKLKIKPEDSKEVVKMKYGNYNLI